MSLLDLAKGFDRAAPKDYRRAQREENQSKTA